MGDNVIRGLVKQARTASRSYEQADANAAAKRAERDEAILALAEATSLRRAARELGITSGRVHQIVARARLTRSSG